MNRDATSHHPAPPNPLPPQTFKCPGKRLCFQPLEETQDFRRPLFDRLDPPSQPAALLRLIPCHPSPCTASPLALLRILNAATSHHLTSVLPPPHWNPCNAHPTPAPAPAAPWPHSGVVAEVRRGVESKLPHLPQLGSHRSVTLPVAAWK